MNMAFRTDVSGRESPLFLGHIMKPLLGFFFRISCLLDGRFDQLSPSVSAGVTSDLYDWDVTLQTRRSYWQMDANPVSCIKSQLVSFDGCQVWQLRTRWAAGEMVIVINIILLEALHSNSVSFCLLDNEHSVWNVFFRTMILVGIRGRWRQTVADSPQFPSSRINVFLLVPKKKKKISIHHIFRTFPPEKSL